MSVSAQPLAIAAVERETGLSKDTLRIWERRYGFPQPLRDAQGERIYPPEQVDKLRLLKRLVGAGHRPGKLLALDAAGLQALGAMPLPAGDQPRLTPAFHEALRLHDVTALRRQLQQALLGAGVERFVTEHVAPITRAVGDAWLRGELTVAQEHVYTEAVQLVLRQAIGTMPEADRSAPLVLMATLPHESHGLGLLMAEVLLSLAGWRCVSLGVNVPMEDLVAAARLVQAQVVALSFSAAFKPAQATAALLELRRRLAGPTQVWVGGACLALQRRLPSGVQAVPDIALLPGLAELWRQALVTAES